MDWAKKALHISKSKTTSAEGLDSDRLIGAAEPAWEALKDDGSQIPNLRPFRVSSWASSKSGSSRRDSIDRSSTTSPRRLLQKSNTSSSTLFESLGRRASRESSLGGLSRASSSTSGGTISTTTDWLTQQITSFGPLMLKPGHVRGKTPYWVLTTEYLVKFKSGHDAAAMFPQLGRKKGDDKVRDAVVIIPIDNLISVFHSESSRPGFGVEAWWSNSGPTGAVAATKTEFFFAKPSERTNMIGLVMSGMRSRDYTGPFYRRISPMVSARIANVIRTEEPGYNITQPEVFPVVRRMRDDKASDSKTGLKRSTTFPLYYFVLGVNLAYLIEFQVDCTKATVKKYSKFGLVTLDAVRGHWAPHEERFILTFRHPFDRECQLELASRYYRDIILTLMKADRFLKPAWPQIWQAREIFKVGNFRELHYFPAAEDHGTVRRTLDAFTSGYNCPGVRWEVNWQTEYAPQFRLLPSRDGSPYSHVQLLAVFRALRYNDYFKSVSFEDIDLGVLATKRETKPQVAYLNRRGQGIDDDIYEEVVDAPLLYQEVHALAYSSGSMRQIDFTSALTNVSEITIQCLGAITSLLRSALTGCSHIVISGNILSSTDIKELVDTFMSQAGDVRGLEVARCGLSNAALKTLVEAFVYQRATLQTIDLSGNPGKLPADLLSQAVNELQTLRKLDVSGTLTGFLDEPLITPESLARFHNSLVELNLSRFNLNANRTTYNAIQSFLATRSTDRLRRLLLNSCDLSGYQAAGLFDVMGNESKHMHLCLNNNPLEHGIDALAESIRRNGGPGGLHMEMIEFHDEENFARLVIALASATRVAALSLVGSSPPGPTSETLCEALENFFVKNKSVRYLDISGYTSKLEDGNMGQGFARSLRGLIRNKTLQQLRVRHQYLHHEIEELAAVVRYNRSLRKLDCTNNGWNWPSFQVLVESLSHSQVECFHCPDSEVDQIERESLKPVAKLQPSGDSAEFAQRVHQGLQDVYMNLEDILSTHQGTSVNSGGDCSSTNVTEWTESCLDVDLASLLNKDRKQKSRMRYSTLPLNTAVSPSYHVSRDEYIGSPTGTADEATAVPELVESPSEPSATFSGGLSRSSTGPVTPEEQTVMSADWDRFMKRFESTHVSIREEVYEEEAAAAAVY